MGRMAMARLTHDFERDIRDAAAQHRSSQQEKRPKRNGHQRATSTSAEALDELQLLRRSIALDHDDPDGNENGVRDGESSSSCSEDSSGSGASDHEEAAAAASSSRRTRRNSRTAWAHFVKRFCEWRGWFLDPFQFWRERRAEILGKRIRRFKKLQKREQRAARDLVRRQLESEGEDEFPSRRASLLQEDEQNDGFLRSRGVVAASASAAAACPDAAAAIPISTAASKKTSPTTGTEKNCLRRSEQNLKLCLAKNECLRWFRRSNLMSFVLLVVLLCVVPLYLTTELFNDSSRGEKSLGQLKELPPLGDVEGAGRGNNINIHNVGGAGAGGHSAFIARMPLYMPTENFVKRERRILVPRRRGAARQRRRREPHLPDGAEEAVGGMNSDGEDSSTSTDHEVSSDGRSGGDESDTGSSVGEDGGATPRYDVEIEAKTENWWYRYRPGMATFGFSTLFLFFLKQLCGIYTVHWLCRFSLEVHQGKGIHEQRRDAPLLRDEESQRLHPTPPPRFCVFLPELFVWWTLGIFYVYSHIVWTFGFPLLNGFLATANGRPDNDGVLSVSAVQTTIGKFLLLLCTLYHLWLSKVLFESFLLKGALPRRDGLASRAALGIFTFSWFAEMMFQRVILQIDFRSPAMHVSPFLSIPWFGGFLFCAYTSLLFLSLFVYRFGLAGSACAAARSGTEARSWRASGRTRLEQRNTNRGPTTASAAGGTQTLAARGQGNATTPQPDADARYLQSSTPYGSGHDDTVLEPNQEWSEFFPDNVVEEELLAYINDEGTHRSRGESHRSTHNSRSGRAPGGNALARREHGSGHIRPSNDPDGGPTSRPPTTSVTNVFPKEALALFFARLSLLLLVFVVAQVFFAAQNLYSPVGAPGRRPSFGFAQFYDFGVHFLLKGMLALALLFITASKRYTRMPASVPTGDSRGSGAGILIVEDFYNRDTVPREQHHRDSARLRPPTSSMSPDGAAHDDVVDLETGRRRGRRWSHRRSGAIGTSRLRPRTTSTTSRGIQASPAPEAAGMHRDSGGGSSLPFYDVAETEDGADAAQAPASMLSAVSSGARYSDAVSTEHVAGGGSGRASTRAYAATSRDTQGGRSVRRERDEGNGGHDDETTRRRERFRREHGRSLQGNRTQRSPSCASTASSHRSGEDHDAATPVSSFRGKCKTIAPRRPITFEMVLVLVSFLLLFVMRMFDGLIAETFDDSQDKWAAFTRNLIALAFYTGLVLFTLRCLHASYEERSAGPSQGPAFAMSGSSYWGTSTGSLLSSSGYEEQNYDVMLYGNLSSSARTSPSSMLTRSSYSATSEERLQQREVARAYQRYKNTIMRRAQTLMHLLVLSLVLSFLFADSWRREACMELEDAVSFTTLAHTTHLRMDRERRSDVIDTVEKQWRLPGARRYWNPLLASAVEEHQYHDDVHTGDEYKLNALPLRAASLVRCCRYPQFRFRAPDEHAEVVGGHEARDAESNEDAFGVVPTPESAGRGTKVTAALEDLFRRPPPSSGRAALHRVTENVCSAGYETVGEVEWLAAEIARLQMYLWPKSTRTADDQQNGVAAKTVPETHGAKGEKDAVWGFWEGDLDGALPSALHRFRPLEPNNSSRWLEVLFLLVILTVFARQLAFVGAAVR